ncbi:MAG: hypothetical protein ABJA11_09825 [Pseudolysinimonas sp.]
MTEHETRQNANPDDAADKPAEDVSHPFDQTNGLVDGLEGDADDPEVFDKTEEATEPTVTKVLPGFNPQL